MELQSSHTSLLIITVFLFSFFVFLGAFQLYYQYTTYRIGKGENITATETDTVLDTLKKVPSWLIIVYFAAIGLVIMKLLGKKKNSKAKIAVDKFEYK